MPSALERETLERVQPYLDNIQGIMNLYQTKLNLYGTGAGMLKSQQNSIYGMQSELTTDKAMDKFKAGIAESDKRLLSSVRSDFSVMDNVRNAMSSFDPITKDPDIILDYKTTSTINSELAKADNDRVVNGGKNFNNASFNELNNLKNLFRKTNNPQFGAQILQMNPKYNSYYDVTAEIKQLKELFQTDVIDTYTAKEGRILTMKDQSWVKDKWQQFVQANASSKLKTQLATEARAEYVGALAYASKPQDVYTSYLQLFNKQHAQSVGFADEALLENSLAIQKLDKSSPTYLKDLRRLNDEKTRISSTIVSLKDPTNPNNHLPLEIVNPEKILGSSQFIEQLYFNEWADKIGTAYAHTDIKYDVKKDGAYWESKALEFKQLELQTNTKIENAKLLFQEKKFEKENELAVKQYELDALKFQIETGLKATKQEDGSYSFEPYRIDAVSSDKRPDKEIGLDILNAHESTLSSAYSTISTTIFGKYFEGDGLLKALLDQKQVYIFNSKGQAIGQKKFRDIVLPTGSTMGKENLLNFLADVYHGTTVYDHYGITETDPIKAKQLFKDKLLDLGGTTIREYLTQAFSNTKLRTFLNDAISKKSDGRKILSEISILENSALSEVEQFDKKYAPKIVGYLKSKLRYPDKIDPVKNKVLWDAGVRGYAQDGEYRVPTIEEIEKYLKVTPDVTSELNQGNKSFLRKVAEFGTLGTKSVILAESIKVTNDLLDSIKNEFADSIGSVARMSNNMLESTTLITSKNAQMMRTKLASYVASATTGKTPDEITVLDIIKNNPDAVSSISEQGSIEGTTSTFSVSFDNSKLTDTQKTNIGSIAVSDIRLNTTSELFPKKLKEGNVGYFKIAHNPETHKVSQFITDEQGKLTPVTGELSVENIGGFDMLNNPPKFSLKTHFYYPIVKKDDLGTIEMTSITEDNFADVFNFPNFEQSLQKDPAAIARFIKLRMEQGTQLIKYIQDNNIKTWLNDKKEPVIPKKVLSEFLKIVEN